MKPVLTALCAVALAGGAANAANVSVDDSTAPWLAYMNVFELPANGGGFVFGSAWAIPDLAASFDDGAGTVTMSPNSIADPDPFWYIGGGGPGAMGNKIMEANLYQESSDGSLSGTTVTFAGFIQSNSFTDAHQARLFIRDFSADYSSVIETFIDADAGAFSFSMDTLGDAGRHVQWGMQVRGENVWITDTAPFGNMVISTVPTPGALALLGLGGLGMARRRRA